MADNDDPAIAPLELFLGNEIPPAGLAEVVVYDQITQDRQKRGLGYGALLVASVTVLMTVSALPFVFALSLWLIAIIAAIPSVSAFYSLAFGPKVWQTLPPGRTIASAKLEETTRQEAAAWNVEAIQWNQALASWTDDHAEWKASKHPSPHIQVYLSERLSSLWDERLALLDRRATIGRLISRLTLFLPPPSDPGSKA